MAVGRIVLTAALCCRARPSEGAINPGSPARLRQHSAQELILNATEKVGGGGGDHLIHPPPEAPPPTTASTQL